jgi:prepilin-type N-terminal cleavage/methylation domain-containing protein
MHKPSRTTFGFTLVELLTVIAIIAILAALIFPAIKNSLAKAEIARAQTEVRGIATAWKTYFNEYGKWPCDPASNTCLPGGQDATEGSSTGVLFDHSFVSLMQGRTTDDPPYVAARDNPKGIAFLQIPTKAIQNGSYVDPWGRPYRMLFDLNYDNVVLTNATSGITNNVIVWSLGPDGINRTKDDVTSWE